MTPHAGMGFGQAIEDGFALAILLTGCTAENAPERLRLYEALRLPHTSQVQEVTRRNAQFFRQIVPPSGRAKNVRTGSIRCGI